MRPNTKSKIYLKPFLCSSVFVSVCVFNVWPKTSLQVPVWPRDAKRLDTPKAFFYEQNKKRNLSLSGEWPPVQKALHHQHCRHKCRCWNCLKIPEKTDFFKVLTKNNRKRGLSQAADGAEDTSCTAPLCCNVSRSTLASGHGRKWAEPWGCSTCLYSQVGESRMPQAACLTSGKPLPVWVLEGSKAGKLPKPHITWHNSAHVSSLHVGGTAYRAQSPGCGNTASPSCPDTWVRKPDCLHLPYNHQHRKKTDLS